jgi:hypothetical protein
MYAGKMALGAAVSLCAVSQIPSTSARRSGTLGNYLKNSSSKAANSPRQAQTVTTTQTAQTITNPSEIDSGLLKYPVTLDGVVNKDEWDNDSIDYRPGWVSGQLAVFDFRTKHDSAFNWMSLVDSQLTSPSFVELRFDTQMTRKLTTGTPGLYNLALKPTTNGWYEAPTIDAAGYVVGTPLSKEFGGPYTRKVDYDWAGTFGSSGMQLEFKFKNELWTNAKDNKINFNAGIITNSGEDAAGFSDAGYVPMVLKQQALPDIVSEGATLAASLGIGKATIDLSKRYSRRDFLRISAANALRKQHS